jgi:hypothetical protein
MTIRVRKALFPAARLGTCLLPATKAQSKEMLSLLDKPIIQYGVDPSSRHFCRISSLFARTSFRGGPHILLDRFRHNLHAPHSLRSQQLPPIIVLSLSAFLGALLRLKPHLFVGGA